MNLIHTGRSDILIENNEKFFCRSYFISLVVGGSIFFQYMKAKKKQLDTVKPEDLGVDVAPRLKTLKVTEPAKRGAGVKVADVAALVEKLKNEAKVI